MTEPSSQLFYFYGKQLGNPDECISLHNNAAMNLMTETEEGSVKVDFKSAEGLDQPLVDLPCLLEVPGDGCPLQVESLQR